MNAARRRGLVSTRIRGPRRARPAVLDQRLIRAKLVFDDATFLVPFNLGRLNPLGLNLAADTFQEVVLKVGYHRGQVQPDGSDGGYQHERHVYARTGEACARCAAAITRRRKERCWPVR